MATFSRVFLSGSPTAGTPPAPTGQVIPVVAVASPGTLIHTAVSGGQSFDEIYLWASNITVNPAVLTIEWGGVVANADWLMRAVQIPPNSAPFPIVIGLGLNAGLIVQAYSDVASAVNISGFVNRIL